VEDITRSAYVLAKAQRFSSTRAQEDASVGQGEEELNDLHPLWSLTSRVKFRYTNSVRGIACGQKGFIFYHELRGSVRGSFESVE